MPSAFFSSNGSRYAKIRSRRHGDAQMIDTNSTAIVADSPANSLTLTPPRNSSPIAIAAITMKAPRSGSSSSSAPTSATAKAIGTKPLRTSCIQSCLRTA